MKKIIVLMLAMIMVISLVACGDSKKQELIDSFNEASDEFNETAEYMNAHLDQVDDELISVSQQMSELLTQYKNIIEGDTEISDEQQQEMIDWFATVVDWANEAKTELEAALE